mgnify:CR=1 FL=1
MSLSFCVTIVTRKLLEHWHDETARQHPFYFCQLEAIETLIWWVEGAEAYKQGIHVPGDGGAWERLCNKMATGAGKKGILLATGIGRSIADLMTTGETALSIQRFSPERFATQLE